MRDKINESEQIGERMKIEKIGYFLSVAKHLNFTKAAQECHIAQPAISRQMSSLEEELGFALFDRSKQGAFDTGRSIVLYLNDALCQRL